MVGILVNVVQLPAPLGIGIEDARVQVELDIQEIDVLPVHLDLDPEAIPSEELTQLLLHDVGLSGRGPRDACQVIPEPAHLSAALLYSFSMFLFRSSLCCSTSIP